jgi:hypothetical protein
MYCFLYICIIFSFAVYHVTLQLMLYSTLDWVWGS